MKTKVLSVLMLGAMFAMTACSSDDDLMDYQTFKPVYNIFYDGGEFVMRNAPKADYEQWKQTLDKAVIYKVNTQTKMWATNKYWSTHYVDFTITDEKYHGVSMFVPQDPTTGYYSALNEKIKELSWYYAVGLEVLDKN